MTDLDTGYTGLAHNSDLTDAVVVKANISCPPTAGPTCGECSIAGIDPEPGNCRCANDKSIKCDQPLAADNTNCGGSTCDCYIGPPLALSASGVPACVLNKLDVDVSGTTNLDTGTAQTNLNLRSVVFTGEGNFNPCPVCGGTCTAGKASGTTCFLDLDCDTGDNTGDGVCSNYDPTAGDGVKGGTCFQGADDGDPCDIDAFNYSFPVPAPLTGGGHSLDCQPAIGKNISGAGLSITLVQTTGSQSLGFNVPCGLVIAPTSCPCGQCTGDNSIPCSSDEQCGDAGTCSAANGVAEPNKCEDYACEEVAGSNGVDGQCTTGPTESYCDGLLQANGKGVLSCLGNDDCLPVNVGREGGSCTVTERRKCFLDPITATGTPDPETPVGIAIFCIPKTGNGGINLAGGLPGAGRVNGQGVVRYLCTNGDYDAGVGCPP